MTKQVGLWIDHRKAVMVTVAGEEITENVVESSSAKRVRFSGGTASGSRGSRGAAGGEDTRERHFEGDLAKFYDRVIAHLGDAEDIFIFGPGEAKTELRAQLEREGLAGRVTGVEAVDKMTSRQISEKVRRRFAAAGPLRIERQR